MEKMIERRTGRDQSQDHGQDRGVKRSRDVQAPQGRLFLRWNAILAGKSPYS